MLKLKIAQNCFNCYNQLRIQKNDKLVEKNMLILYKIEMGAIFNF